jgi:solute carrier family 34 (sodium-dependent phosphate cotransporter)
VTKIGKNILSDKRVASSILLISLGLYGFFLSIELISVSFTHTGRETAESIIILTSNPFVGLFIGLLLTAIVQSSSTTTSLIVAVVASGSVEMKDAIPMVMGANIGTTITSAIVSLSFIAKKREFRKAVSAGVVHDFFNILVAAILFPLEYFYGLLSKFTLLITDIFSSSESVSSIETSSFDLLFTQRIAEKILYVIDQPIIMIALALILLFGSIKLMSNLLFGLLQGEFEEKFKRQLKNPYSSLLWGSILTASVQSSSVTTSLIVPVVATGKITLKRAFPFIMGANIGTTITAFLAALFKTDAAISIAIAHFLFNLVGVLIFFPFAAIRNIPVRLAKDLGKMTLQNRLIGFIYIIITFFIIPFLLIYLNQA